MRAALPRKLESKDLSIAVVTAERPVQRYDEFASDWNRNPVHLIPRENAPPFDAVWEKVYRYTRQNLPEER